MNNGLAEQKWPNQPPEHAREIIIRKAWGRNSAFFPYPVMGALVSGGRRRVLGNTGSRISPTLNVVHAESTILDSSQYVPLPEGK